MSFRFDVVREEWRDNTGALIKPDEIGPLLWNPGDRGPLRADPGRAQVPRARPGGFPGLHRHQRRRPRPVPGRRPGPRHGRATGAAPLPGPGRDCARRGAEAPDDPALRRQVAASLLFGRPGDLARGVHMVIDLTADTGDPTPSPPVPRRPHLLPGYDRAARTRAPGRTRHRWRAARREHPPATGTTDAPPADGHPSPSPRTARMKSQLAEIGELMDDVLASIDTERRTGNGPVARPGGHPPARTSAPG
jgi:hypothetical protein